MDITILEHIGTEEEADDILFNDWRFSVSNSSLKTLCMMSVLALPDVYDTIELQSYISDSEHKEISSIVPREYLVISRIFKQMKTSDLYKTVITKVFLVVRKIKIQPEDVPQENALEPVIPPHLHEEAY